MTTRAIALITAASLAGGAVARPAHAGDAAQPGVLFESIRWAPRFHGEHRSEERDGTANGFVELHGGYFNPKGDVANSVLFGTRIGTSFDDRVQLGVAVDWSHRSDNQGTVVGTSPLPGGGTVERRIDLARVSSDLVPVLGFFQISPAGRRGGPYVGVAGGYEALFVSADDFATGAAFDATFDGWAWQYYGGVALPLSRLARLNVEAFVNDGDLDRETYDPSTGVTYRDVVDAAGVGLRFGVSWAF